MTKNIPKEHHLHRPGDWLPQDHRIHHDWLRKTVNHVDNNPKELQPVLKEFQQLIETNSRIYMLCNGMFQEVPNKKPYKNDPTGKRQIRDSDHMLQVLNHILTTAPHWNDANNQIGMVGTPVNAIFDWCMGTPSGYAFFLDPDVNKMLKKVLNKWAEYLGSPESASVLSDDATGWMGDHSKKALEMVANAHNKTNHKFEDLFVCDPSAKHHGYTSWDNFFTRHIKESVRPIAGEGDDDIIANACESRPYNVGRDVKLRDHFWIKGQPYSLTDMLSQDELAQKFVGGTVYQAFLSALSYHRWHTPVSGKIVKQYVVDGTYFSEPLFEGIGAPENTGINLTGESSGQGYITATATRAIIFIEADNPKIGLIAFLGIGMTEVSTCDITVKEGQQVKKGDELGMFHFGGSSHCVIFGKQVKLEGFPNLDQEENLPVRAQLAKVVS